MNEIVNKSFLIGDKFIPELHLKQRGFACGPFAKNKTNKFKNLKKQEIQNIFTEMNYIKLVFNMIWLLEILKI